MFNRLEEGMYWDKALRLVEGCTPLSAGCDNCWAKAQCHMRKHQINNKIKKQYPKDCTDRKGNWTGIVHCLEQNLKIPLKTKQPAVFSIWNDLFHEDVTHEFIFEVWKNLENCSNHIFLILTKRPKRMKAFLEYHKMIITTSSPEGFLYKPADNIWLGVTAENQEQADKRIPILLTIPAAKRFVSVEPMLDEVDLVPYMGGNAYRCKCEKEWHHTQNNRLFIRDDIAMCIECGHYVDIFPTLDWVICGGETGTNARPMHPDWAMNLKDQCFVTETPFFFKQWGSWMKRETTRLLDGKEYNQLPVKMR